jgi:integrase/recombinase XerC
MATPFRIHSTRPLPADAVIVDHKGKPCVRMIDHRGRPVFYRLTKDGRSYLKPSRSWFFYTTDTNGKRQRVKGCSDLSATQTMAANAQRRAERIKAGIIDPSDDHLRRPLAEHLDDYATHLRAKGDTETHIELTRARIELMRKETGAVYPLDIDVGRVAEFLNKLRADKAPIAIPDDKGKGFAPSAVAKLLGVGMAAIRSLIKRLHLSATGNGKARRLPRATVEVLATEAGKGCAPATINHYIRAVRGFFRWLVKAKRLPSNPLESLALVNESVDVRRARRELTAEELRKLFDATRTSKRVLQGTIGPDRYFLYLVASATGFRAGALAVLTPADFDLDAATLTLAARHNKSRKLKVQPLPSDVVNALCPFLEEKPADAPLWPALQAGRAAAMLRADLDAASVPYIVDGPDGPLHADFHSLRHSYITALGRAGVDLRTAQELAGHSTPVLTARYSHVRLHDMTGAVAKLPDLVSASEPASEAPLRLTGTDDSGISTGVPPGVPESRVDMHRSAPPYTKDRPDASANRLSQPLADEAVCTNPHSGASDFTSGPAGNRTLICRIMSPSGSVHSLAARYCEKSNLRRQGFTGQGSLTQPLHTEST